MIAERTLSRWKYATFAALLLCIGSLVACAIVVTVPIRIARLADARLDGTWQSDADRTIANMTAGEPLTPEREAALRRLFGKMKVSYSPAVYTTDLDGSVETYSYEILGRDKHSVVIRTVESKPSPIDILELTTFTIIQFDGPDSYWVSSKIAGTREYFRRVR